jgi:transglutaminase-like putative cysteine protease
MYRVKNRQPCSLLLLILAGCIAVGAARAQQPTASPTASPAYHLEMAPARHIRTTYTFQVHTPKFAPQDWVLFAAMPPILDGQRDLHVTMNHEGHLDTEKSPLRRPILAARVSAREADETQGVTVEVDAEATLYSRKLVPGAPAKEVAPLDAEERRLALAKTPTEDFTDPGFLAWLQRNRLIRGGKETDIDFAQRAFLTIKRGSTYLYTGPFQARQASRVCQDLRTDCGGFAVLLVSTLRANRVPARTLCGRWAKSAGANEPMMQMHVKAEFWAEGIGWIPCDLSSAVQFDRGGSTLRYFGEDPGDHLVQHTDTDLRFDTLYFGEKAQAFVQRAAYWVRGAGTLADSRERETWLVEDLPLVAAPRGE